LVDASVLSIVAGLEGYDPNGLRRQWRAHLGGEPPMHLPRWLLMRVLAYRLQADAFGGLDKSIQSIRSNKNEDGAAYFDRRAPQTRDGVGLKVGAMLAREWNGKLERVMVLEEGFAWDGRTFGSLSQIAKAMTGTNWNGHRFFYSGSCRLPGGAEGIQIANPFMRYGCGWEHSSFRTARSAASNLRPKRKVGLSNGSYSRTRKRMRAFSAWRREVVRPMLG
jgi:Protein of unknown function (DUF2924)